MLLALALVVVAAPLEDVVARVDDTVVLVKVATRLESQTESSAMVAITLGTGSGVLVHQKGYVVTAAHVVEDASAVEVVWRTGFKAPAKVVTLSRTEDLALLKVEAIPPGAVVARLGNSDALRPGQRLFAVGAPYGLDHSVTSGIVSALRENPDRGLVPRKLIQTDVPINQGNSGGPLFNDAGEVVGIASFILSRSGGSVGLNFAVPSSSVRLRLFEQPLPYIGVSLRYIPTDVAELFNWPVETGLLVEKVRPDSPAEEGGLRAGQVPSVVGGNDVILGGDVIIKVNGVDTSSTEKVAEALRVLKAGDVIHYVVLRAGRTTEVDVTIPEGLDIPALPPLPKPPLARTR